MMAVGEHPETDRALGQSGPGGTATRLDFAAALLPELSRQTGIAFPVTQQNLRTLVAWMEAENTRAANNPLATTMGHEGHKRAAEFPSTRFNSANVQNYNTFEIGVQATAATLKLGYYREIRNLLQTGTASIGQVAAAVDKSPWGTGNFAGRTGESANTPLGSQTHATGGEGDPYSAYPADPNGEGSSGQSTFSGVDGTDDLDAMIAAKWPNGIPEDVQWTDLPPEMQTEVQKEMGFQTTYLEHPELGSILIRAALEGWSDELIQNHIENTDWWRETDLKSREWEALTITDPAEAGRRRDGSRAVISDHAKRAGVHISDADMSIIVEEALRFGWNEAQIIDAVIGHANFNPSNPAPVGDLGTIAQSIGERAAGYGLSYSDESLFDFAKRVAAGELEEEDLRGVFIEQAKGRFPWMTDQFEQGYTLTQLMDTRAGEVSRILGIDQQEVDFLNDPRFQPILEYTPDDGETRSMSLSETRRYIGSLPEYEYTDDAQARGSSFARKLLQTFGAI